jgi:diguanylate cyclase (GGDEF)-like protein/PAS domain S-box-containing protein
MVNQTISIEQKIEKERIDNLFRRSNTASFTLLVINTIYVLVLTQKFDWQPLFVWYLVLIAVLFGRWQMVRFYTSEKGRTKSLSFWLGMFRLGILAAGLTVGSLNLLFFSREPLSYLFIAVIFPFGITVGAVTMLVDFCSFFLYVITLMTPAIYQTALAGDRLYTGTGILTFVLVLFFLRFSREYNSNFITNMRLRYENKALLEDLEEEKNKLNNRLGRILNDSTTEIFVADAESLKCLQVNQGAVENLGYSKDEFHDITLLDIFTDLDQHSLTELLAPLYAGGWEPVVHNGINRRKDGSTYPVEARLQLSTLDVPPIIVANVQDITERTKWEAKLTYQANFDQLTGLVNRHHMQSYMHSVFPRARRQRKKVALLFIDLDNFKTINDTLGHVTGDEVLKETANRISSQLRESDIAARTGGDEFTVLLESIEESAHAEVVARKLVDICQQPLIVKGQEIYTTVSIGISIYPDDGTSHDQLMQCADMAMYQAKEDGRNIYRSYSHEMRRSSEKEMLISNHLRYALAKDELSLFFQPKIDISKGRIIGAEALLRWHNPVLGNISPVVFIPLAEKLGLVDELGTWVLKRACREAMRWQGLSSEKLQVSVNVSPQQFRTGTLLEAVESALELSGLPCDQLELEITESLLMQDSEKPLAILKNLHDQGVSLALDDFGTGYSSLSYLRRFPLQVLKIDRSFIHDLEEDQNNKVLVDAIIAMAHSLKLGIVAEGVETEEQLDFLRQRDVTIIQGYFFSPPVPAEKFQVLLQG